MKTFSTRLSHPRLIIRSLFAFTVFALVPAALQAQSPTLALGSGSGQPGTTVSVPLTLTTNGTQLSAVMWTLAYAASDITKVSVTAGSAATAAGKGVDCALQSSGRFGCLVSGTNKNVIGTGTLATATFTLASNISASSTTVQLMDVKNASPAGDPLTATATGGSLTVNRSLALSSVACSPTSITAPGSTQCTVGLTGAAPSTGLAVSLGYSATSAAITMPSSLQVPAGASSASFTLQATSATASTTVQVTASASGISKSTSVTVAPAVAGVIGVAVSPATATLAAGQSKQFSASVSGTTNTSVRWSLYPSNLGKVSSSGLYTAPASVTSQQTVWLRATSAADSTKHATAVITINPGTTAPADTIPPTISSAVVTPSSTSAIVQWTTNEAATGEVAYGSSSSSLSLRAAGSSMVTSHRVTLSGLTAGVTYYYRITVKDGAGNTAVYPATGVLSFKTSTTTSSQTYSFFPAGATPTVLADSDSRSVELGMKFSSSTSGYVTGIRFYKGSSQNGGTHVGNLWSASGQKLASATFVNETSSGWQQVMFSTPVRIQANVTYVVSYLAPYGRYSASESYFVAQASSGPLTVPSNAGVYVYTSSSGFPTSTYRASNYWVDVIFKP